jgi:AraC family transcriptional activator of tynA and feaB
MIEEKCDLDSTAMPSVSLSTSAVRPGERVDFWQEVIRDKIIPVDFKVADKRAFSAAMEWSAVGQLQITDLRVSAHQAERGRAAIDQAGSESLIFNFMLAGSGESMQDGKSARLEPGRGAFCNGARPFTLQFSDDAHFFVLQIPHASLNCKVASLDRATSCDLAHDNQLFPLVSSYIAQLASRRSFLPAAANRISTNLIDLVSAMVSESLDRKPVDLSEYKTATLTRLHAFVDERIGDPDLNCASVALALGLTQRYLNKLLEAEDTSLGRLIWRRRLDMIKRDLRNPALSSRSISTIALARGFNDLGHFSKTFRKHHGMSPREYRTMSVQ